MKTLIEIAKENGAIVFNEINKSNIVFKTEAQLIATFDDYCQQFEAADAERYYDLGFNTSAEGFNGEHGSDMASEYYKLKRTEAIDQARGKA